MEIGDRRSAIELFESVAQQPTVTPGLRATCRFAILRNLEAIDNRPRLTQELQSFVNDYEHDPSPWLKQSVKEARETLEKYR